MWYDDFLQDIADDQLLVVLSRHGERLVERAFADHHDLKFTITPGTSFSTTIVHLDLDFRQTIQLFCYHHSLPNVPVNLSADNCEYNRAKAAEITVIRNDMTWCKQKKYLVLVSTEWLLVTCYQIEQASGRWSVAVIAHVAAWSIRAAGKTFTLQQTFITVLTGKRRKSARRTHRVRK